LIGPQSLDHLRHRESCGRKRRPRLTLNIFCKTLVPVLLCLSLASHAAKAEPLGIPSEQMETSVAPPPVLNGQPLQIRVGLYILNLVSLNEVEQTFSCTVYLTSTWKDPRLAFSPKADDPHRRFLSKKDIWFPMLQFDNAAGPPTVIGYVISGDPDGTIHNIEKMSVTLSSDMELRAFPFDSQELEVYVHPFNGQVDRIMLAPDPRATGLSSAAYSALPLWDTGQVTYRSVAGEIEKGSKAQSHVVFGIHIVRHAQYYIFRIFLPLFLMVAVSWGVLWIPPNDLNSQLLISVTTVLTLVAFSVAISNVLPPVAYLTFYDGFFLLSFLFILLTIGEALAVHTLHGSANGSRALRVRRATRRLLPLSFVLAILLIAFIFIF